MFEKAAKEYIKRKKATAYCNNSEVNKERQPRLEKRAESQRVRAKAKAVEKLHEGLDLLVRAGASEAELESARKAYLDAYLDLSKQSVAS